MPRTEAEDRRALEALFVDHERALYNVAYRRVWNRADAGDVVQDAFVRLWGKRTMIDWERAVGLAYQTVLGLAANRRRGNAIRALVGRGGDRRDDHGDEPLAVAAASGAPDAMLREAETDLAVRRAIDRLPGPLRDALLLCTFSELDQAAIGAVLGVAAGTVGSRRHEAIARIRATLGQAHHG